MESLPAELMLVICEYLPTSGVLNPAATCKRLNSLLVCSICRQTPCIKDGSIFCVTREVCGEFTCNRCENLVRRHTYVQISLCGKSRDKTPSRACIAESTQPARAIWFCNDCWDEAYYWNTLGWPKSAPKAFIAGAAAASTLRGLLDGP